MTTEQEKRKKEEERKRQSWSNGSAIQEVAESLAGFDSGSSCESSSSSCESSSSSYDSGSCCGCD